MVILAIRVAAKVRRFSIRTPLVTGWIDGAVMDMLIYGNEIPIPEEFASTGLEDDGSDG
ncbi:MAG TPA: hypothetical protein VF516_03455 [Kofleriaceae bacterium]